MSISLLIGLLTWMGWEPDSARGELRNFSELHSKKVLGISTRRPNINSLRHDMLSSPETHLPTPSESSMSKVFLTLFAFAGLLQTGCAREERMIPMISTADPVLLREVSNAELRANLTLARAGNREAMSILVSYYLNNDMPKQAEYWGDLHDKAVKLGQ